MAHHPDNTLEAAANKLLDATGEPGTRLVEVECGILRTLAQWLAAEAQHRSAVDVGQALESPRYLLSALLAEQILTSELKDAEVFSPKTQNSEEAPEVTPSGPDNPRSLDGYSDRAMELSKILSNERVSVLMETLRILGWSLPFSVEDEETTGSAL